VWSDDPDLARLRAATYAAVKAAQREREAPTPKPKPVDWLAVLNPVQPVPSKRDRIRRRLQEQQLAMLVAGIGAVIVGLAFAAFTLRAATSEERQSATSTTAAVSTTTAHPTPTVETDAEVQQAKKDRQDNQERRDQQLLAGAVDGQIFKNYWACHDQTLRADCHPNGDGRYILTSATAGHKLWWATEGCLAEARHSPGAVRCVKNMELSYSSDPVWEVSWN
jgi:hypothetical protein